MTKFPDGSPTGLTELYFTPDAAGEKQHAACDYTPEGIHIEDPDGKVNSIGQPRIIGKGILNEVQIRFVHTPVATEGLWDENNPYSN